MNVETESYASKKDEHLFFFGKAIDIAIAERSQEQLSQNTGQSVFFDYIASLARALHLQYELSLDEKDRYQKLSQSEREKRKFPHEV
tara:strand:+ start:483 stop:743 length:261 start_codon:yes stop_codon:yes gene_type:complete